MFFYCFPKSIVLLLLGFGLSLQFLPFFFSSLLLEELPRTGSLSTRFSMRVSSPLFGGHPDHALVLSEISAQMERSKVGGCIKAVMQLGTLAFSRAQWLTS